MTVKVYRDKLLRASVVVQTAPRTFWLVPKSPDGWKCRVRVVQRAEVRADRLTLATDVDSRWLGLPDATFDDGSKA